MTYAIDTIIRHTRIAMGLNPEAEAPWHADAVCRQLTPDTKINLEIEQAARAICVEADEAMLAECTRTLASQPIFKTDNCGSVALPPDFMRLCAFCMDDWERPVRNAVDPGSVSYLMLHSRFAGLGGNPQRPGCAIVCSAGGLSLEFYGCKSKQARIKTALYHPLPTVGDGELRNMPGVLYPRLIARLAANG